MDSDQEKLQRKRRIGEPESLIEKRLRAHFRREAALWEEHERTLAAELAVWKVKRAAFFTGEDVGRRRQGERAAKGISQTEWHHRCLADECRRRVAKARKQMAEWERELDDLAEQARAADRELRAAQREERDAIAQEKESNRRVKLGVEERSAPRQHLNTMQRERQELAEYWAKMRKNARE